MEKELFDIFIDEGSFSWHTGSMNELEQHFQNLSYKQILAILAIVAVLLFLFVGISFIPKSSRQNQSSFNNTNSLMNTPANVPSSSTVSPSGISFSSYSNRYFDLVYPTGWTIQLSTIDTDGMKYTFVPDAHSLLIPDIYIQRISNDSSLPSQYMAIYAGQKFKMSAIYINGITMTQYSGNLLGQSTVKQIVDTFQKNNQVYLLVYSYSAEQASQYESFHSQLLNSFHLH